jgi:natural product precursor
VALILLSVKLVLLYNLFFQIKIKQMKKKTLSIKKLEKVEVLSKEQLKVVMGGAADSGKMQANTYGIPCPPSQKCPPAVN